MAIFEWKIGIDLWHNKVMTEIEIRGKLSKSDFENLFPFLNKKGKIKNHYHRLSVDISFGFDKVSRKWNNTTLVDLRIKKSDDEEKITVKIGRFDRQRRFEEGSKQEQDRMANAYEFNLR